jgi:hypothetical protein
MSDFDIGADPHELRESVRDYRNPATTDQDRDDIRAYWADHGIPNQAAAMLRAAAIERARG